jgi:hypothetical protein
MQTIEERAAKCLHYFKTNSKFAHIVDDGNLSISQTNTILSQKFSDLQMSNDELESFYRGRKNRGMNGDDIEVFYRAGELAYKFLEEG